MHFNDIPFEVIQAILSILPRQSLASSSLVCKVWRSATLPLLYRSVCFPLTTNFDSAGFLERSSFENHPEELVNRIAHETNDDGLEFQFSSCVRRLRAVLRMNEEQLRTFGSVVSRMKNLEHLTWVVSKVNKIRWYDTLVRLCQELPKLRSLELVMALNEFLLDNPDEVNSGVAGSNQDSLFTVDRLGPLVGIKALSIGFDEQTGEEQVRELPTTIVKLICSANNIESLIVDSEQPGLQGIFQSENWGLDDMFLALSSHYFPLLRQFCMGAHDHPLYKK
ncbi:unnamed protein product [Rhizoctonia solani]|uniref:F-box domain-containing protein n=1 Tax=Rhizoctonia solani TaxID=456999 RepID=A0A8H2XR52_9AGAM|nr:unnamed protein product [Rhizoctonia solani]